MWNVDWAVSSGKVRTRLFYSSLPDDWDPDWVDLPQTCAEWINKLCHRHTNTKHSSVKTHESAYLFPEILGKDFLRIWNEWGTIWIQNLEFTTSRSEIKPLAQDVQRHEMTGCAWGSAGCLVWLCLCLWERARGRTHKEAEARAYRCGVMYCDVEWEREIMPLASTWMDACRDYHSKWS